MFSDALMAQAESLIRGCQDVKVRLSIAESCTGGLITGLLTAVSGASEVLERGFVTYSNEAKTDMLGVPEATLAQHGAVSEATARAMAAGALSASNATLSASVTGIAGPGGGSTEKPVGLVHIATAHANGTVRHERHLFDGDRHSVREQSIAAVLALLQRSVE